MTWTPPEHDPAREIRDHSDETGWLAGMEAICAREGLDPGGLTPCASGSDVVWTNGTEVIKLTPARWARQVEWEARVLAYLHGRLPVATPKHLASGEIGGWRYNVMTRLPGEPIGVAWDRAQPAERLRLAAELGRLARVLHDLPGPPEARPWPEFWEHCQADAKTRHAGAPLAHEVGPFLAEMGSLSEGRHGLLHTELLDQHVLVAEQDGRTELSGLIDVADACVGPAEYEVSGPVEFLFRGEPGALRAYLLATGESASNLTPARSRELLAWGLCHRFGSLERMLRASPGPVDSLADLASGLYSVAEADSSGS